MAETEDGTEKSEEPTGKRLGDAHSKGQVAKSQEVTNWFMMAGIALAVTIFARDIAIKVSQRLVPFIEQAHAIPTDPLSLRDVVLDVVSDLALVVFPALALLILASLAGNMVQHKPVWAPYKLKPKLSNLSLIKGFKNRFSSASLVEFAKSLVKFAVIGTATGLAVLPEMRRLPVIMTQDLSLILEDVRELALIMLVVVMVIMAFIAVADFMYQKYAFIKGQRMTKDEVKDEFKQSEGDPKVKRQLAKIRLERTRERMMAAVPGSDVVVTNPTHYAVALSYDPDSMNAPKAVAKGQDWLAQRIRRVAEENKVPIVENPPLARGLYDSVEIDREIPVEYYKAVAEVIGYVMRLKRKVAGRAASRGR